MSKAAEISHGPRREDAVRPLRAFASKDRPARRRRRAPVDPDLASAGPPDDCAPAAAGRRRAGRVATLLIAGGIGAAALGLAAPASGRDDGGASDAARVGHQGADPVTAAPPPGSAAGGHLGTTAAAGGSELTLEDLEIRGELLVPGAVFIVGGVADDATAAATVLDYIDPLQDPLDSPGLVLIVVGRALTAAGDDQH